MQFFNQDGKLLTKIPAEVSTTADVPFMIANRMDFIHAMATAIGDLGIPLHLGSRVTNVDPESATITLENGNTVKGDFVIAGDGLKSICRELVDNSSESGLQRSGNSSDNAVVKTSIMEADPDLQDLVGRITIWVGPKAHHLLMPVRNGELHAFVTSRPDDGDRGEWSHTHDTTKLEKFFKGWDIRLVKLVRHMETAIRIGCVYRPDLHTWHKKRLVLLGDSAHAILPFTGQGVSQALEDVDLLAALLKRMPKDGDLVTNLENVFTELYNLRHERASAISKVALKNMPLLETDVPDEMKKRDDQFADAPGPTHPLFFKNTLARENMFGYKTESLLPAATTV